MSYKCPFVRHGCHTSARSFGTDATCPRPLAARPAAGGLLRGGLPVQAVRIPRAGGDRPRRRRRLLVLEPLLRPAVPRGSLHRLLRALLCRPCGRPTAARRPHAHAKHAPTRAREARTHARNATKHIGAPARTRALSQRPGRTSATPDPLARCLRQPHLCSGARRRDRRRLQQRLVARRVGGRALRLVAHGAS